MLASRRIGSRRTLVRLSACSGLMAVWIIAAPLGVLGQTCAGDCDGSGTVTVDELVRGVNIGLGFLLPDACPGIDRDSDGTVAVDELIAAVKSSIRGCGAESTLTVRGVVRESEGSSPLANASVEASVDRNRDGSIDASEQVSTTTDDQGAYELAVNTITGDRVVVRFGAAGYADGFRTVTSAADAEAMLDAVLSQLEDLSCTGPRCALENSSLSVVGLPEGASGSARVFNPVTDTQAFPGGFGDSEGNLLASGVFASIELEDEGGQPLHELSEPVTLRMRLPRETWNVVQDVTPGNGTIDVPLYSFDEVRGTWVRDGQAVVEDAGGATVGENDLESIRSGAFTGALFARGDVNHFSYWNVDWPIETHAAIEGTITDPGGDPAEGATVQVRGTTYTGSSEVQTTGGNGRFCTDVLRSEAAGEDLDQNGVTGEKQRVSVRITYQGKVYDGGEYETPATQGSCGAGGAADIGTIQLTPERELIPQLCTLMGTVRDLQAVPVAGASVVAGDDTVPPEVADDLCKDQPFGFCLGVGTSDETGAFEITIPILENPTYAATYARNEGGSTLFLVGQGNLSECPSEPIDVFLSNGLRFVDLTLTASPDGTIAWEPAQYKATSLNVTAQDTVKWVIYAAAVGFDSPVVYGSVPEGAEQLFPVQNAPPAPLASGDMVSVFTGGVGEDGYPYYATGLATIP